MSDLRDLFYPPITFERFAALRAKSPKRICFGSTHKKALKKAATGKAVGFLNVPFSESFAKIFPWQMFPNSKGMHGGYFRAINSSDEYAQISAWLEQRSNLVFIRSLFTTAIAAAEHYADDGRTRIGELEKAAKYDADLQAREKVAEILEGVYSDCHVALGVSAIVSVPSSNPASLSLPNFLAKRLSEKLAVPDLTSEIAWAGPKGEIKALTVEQKWHALAGVGMIISKAVEGKNLLLIDDMYQSGATAHYVASRLRAAGANDLHLLCVSKGRRDTDNQ